MADNINSEIERDERIARFMKGEMDSREEVLFLSDMESDEKLRLEAIAQARLIKGMSQADKDIVCELKKAPESQIITMLRTRRSPFRKYFKWMSMAASIAILLFAGYKGYDYYDTTRLGMRYANAFPMETVVRGDSNSIVDSELQELFDNVVERKDLRNTTERLAELWEIANQDTYNNYTDYAQYIGWYLAIGYLEDYEKNKAKSVLLTMVKQKEFCSKVLQNEITMLIAEI